MPVHKLARDYSLIQFWVNFDGKRTNYIAQRAKLQSIYFLTLGNLLTRILFALRIYLNVKREMKSCIK